MHSHFGWFIRQFELRRALVAINAHQVRCARGSLERRPARSEITAPLLRRRRGCVNGGENGNARLPRRACAAVRTFRIRDFEFSTPSAIPLTPRRSPGRFVGTLPPPDRRASVTRTRDACFFFVGLTRRKYPLDLFDPVGRGPERGLRGHATPTVLFRLGLRATTAVVSSWTWSFFEIGSLLSAQRYRRVGRP